MADLASLKEIDDVLLKPTCYTKLAELVKGGKLDAHNAEEKPPLPKTFACFKFNLDFCGSLVNNGLIYTANSNCRLLHSSFVFGVLHSDVEQLFLHPTISLLITPEVSSGISHF